MKIASLKAEKLTPIILLSTPFVLMTIVLFTSLQDGMGALAASILEVNVPVTLSMNASGDVDLPITPTASGAFMKRDMQVTVSTNNSTGFSLTLADSDEDVNMKHLNPSIPALISPVAGNVTEAGFAVNTWGYSLDETNFKAVPAQSASETIKNTLNPSAGEVTRVSFGAKVDNSLPAGAYQDRVVFSAVANYVPPKKTFGGITTMQEMTSLVCQDETTPLNTATEFTFHHTNDNTKIPQTLLKDSRDNKQYLIRKLADGNCWMVQNLDLDLSIATTLDNTSSDLNSKTNWTPVSDTTQVEGFIQAGGSYDPGEVAGDITIVNYDGVDKTLHAGNFYTEKATVTEDGILNIQPQPQDYPDSICPKGWRMPYGKHLMRDKSFKKLLKSYETTEGVISAAGVKAMGIYQNGRSYSVKTVLINGEKPARWWTSSWKHFGTSGDSINFLAVGMTGVPNGGAAYSLDIDETSYLLLPIRCVSR